MNNECFPDATPDWPRRTISALARINPRYPIKKGQELPFVEMAAVAERFGGIRRYDSRRLEASGLAKFKNGDTLFAKITPCPQNGKIAFVANLPAEFGIGSTEFIVLSPRPDCDPRFLYHLLCDHAIRGRAAARMEGSTGRQRVPDDVFQKRLLVPVPDPEHQAAISKVLDAVEDAVTAAAAATIASQALTTALVLDELNRQDAPRHRLKDYITDIRYGTSQASNDRNWGVPALRIPNVIGDQLSLSDVTYIDAPADDVARLKLRDGDLLLVRTNGNPNYVGRSVVFRQPDQQTWIYASYLIRARLTNDLVPEYVNVFLSTERGRRELLRRVTTSAGNHNINANSIRLLTLPVPKDKKSQQRIVDVASCGRDRTNALKAKTAALSDLRMALLRDLVTGKVRVTDLGCVAGV